MKSQIIPIFITFMLSFTLINAYIPRFHNGRPRGGFLGKPRHSALVGEPKIGWFKQRLDHFNFEDDRTWLQRYVVNDTFFKAGGPLFVQIGGEGPLAPIFAVVGNWMNYAQASNALCVLVEHRYYGQSHPTPNIETSNMVYLSSEQALSDIAAIIIDFQAKYNTSKTLVFGGSYAGSLAAWFRLKYPHLAYGAISSSAPLLAKVDFFEYIEVVYQSLRTYKNSTSCDDNIYKATKSLEGLMATSVGRTKLKKMFQLCDDIDATNAKDIATLSATLAGNIMGVVQYDKDNNNAYEGAISIDTICDMMTDEKRGDPLQRYAQINDMFLQLYLEECVDFKYDKMISDLRETEWTSEGTRQWIYQTCTEFGFYQSTDSPIHLFGHEFPLEFWIEQCMDIFGKDFNETFIASAVKRSNGNYGGLGIQVSRVVIYNGSLDPWHALGITSQTELPEVHTFYVNGTAHCAVMYPPSEDDVPGLQYARQETQNIIKNWGF